MNDHPVPRHSPGPSCPHHGEVLMALLNEIKGDVAEIKAGVEKQNGRVRTAEVAIGRLHLAVFGGGALLVSGVGYLIAMHLK